MDLCERHDSFVHRHPWEVARSRFFRKVLANHFKGAKPARILDVGAGDGWFSQQLRRDLEKDTEIVCWDVAYSDKDVAGFLAQAGTGFRFQRHRPSEPFELLLLLDVLEHVENDGGFLDVLVKENLVPRGIVLVSVPAWMFLFGAHDVHLGHVRRYATSACANLLRRHGLEMLSHGGLFHALALVRAVETMLRRARPAGHPPSDVGTWRHGPRVTNLIDRALRFDNELSMFLANMNLEIPGLSWWALCQKQS